MDVTEETRGNLNMGCVSRFGGSGNFAAIEQGVSSERHSGRSISLRLQKAVKEGILFLGAGCQNNGHDTGVTL